MIEDELFDTLMQEGYFAVVECNHHAACVSD